MDVIANEAGTLQERLSFDGHGRRRNANEWRAPLVGYLPQTTPDGFTGHEHLDLFGLVHMTSGAGVAAELSQAGPKGAGQGWPA